MVSTDPYGCTANGKFDKFPRKWELGEKHVWPYTRSIGLHHNSPKHDGEEKRLGKLGPVAGLGDLYSVLQA